MGLTTGFPGHRVVIWENFTFNSLPSQDCAKYCNCVQSGGMSLSNSPRVVLCVSSTDSLDLFLFLVVLPGFLPAWRLTFAIDMAVKLVVALFERYKLTKEWRSWLSAAAAKE